MLLKDPEQFYRVAREWAIKHANAPPTTNWESSIVQKSPQPKPKTQKVLSREEELRQEMLRWDFASETSTLANLIIDTKVTIKI